MKVKKNFSLKKIVRQLDLTREINLMADAITNDHKKRGRFGIGIHGRKLKKLKGGTIAQKRATNKPKPRIPLYGEGIMTNVVVTQRANKANQQARIKPPKSRQEVGVYHQNGTRPFTITARNGKVLGPMYNSRGQKFFAKSVRNGGLPKREWFGVTKEMEAKGLKRIARKIDRALKG